MPELYLLHLGARHGAADVDYEDDVLRDGGQPGGCEEVDEVSVVQLEDKQGRAEGWAHTPPTVPPTPPSAHLHVPRGVRPRHVVLQHKTTQCCPVLGGGREGNMGAVRAFLHPDGRRQPPCVVGGGGIRVLSTGWKGPLSAQPYLRAEAERGAQQCRRVR